MKLKYYMRGLGIGIVVTSLLMGYSGRAGVSEAKVEYREEESTQEDVSLTLKEQQELVEQQESEAVGTEEMSEEAVTETEPESESEEPKAEVDLEDENLTEELLDDIQMPKGTLKDGDVVVITVYTGEGSGTVSRKLQLAGVIDNAEEFDAYLMQHGFDKNITKGDHEVIVGSAWMDIAKQLTK